MIKADQSNIFLNFYSWYSKLERNFFIMRQIILNFELKSKEQEKSTYCLCAGPQ